MNRYSLTIQPTDFSLASDSQSIVGLLTDYTTQRSYSLLVKITYNSPEAIVTVLNEEKMSWEVVIPFNENTLLAPQIEAHGDLITNPPKDVPVVSVMTFEEYSLQAGNTRVYKKEYNVIYPALKLTGEAGEVSEKIGKHLRDNDGDFSNPQFRESIKKELGDVLWYIDAMAKDLGMTLQEIAQENIKKLSQRKDKGTLHGSGDNR